jgi:predicted transglutaminase-like cysteine proteinase
MNITAIKKTVAGIAAGIMMTANAGAMLATIGLTDARAASVIDAFAVESGITSIPVGHAQFCAQNPVECQPNATVVEKATLTERNWQQLLEVNSRFNTEVQPVTDMALYKTEEYWTYPRGYGDCEDYVLAKRRALIQLGWAPSTLLVTVVREADGGGHAVLTARTDRGDLVLDNQEALIKLWSETPYRFVKRQSQRHAGVWVNLIDARSITVANR